MTDYTHMSSGDFIEAIGNDGMKWTEAFRQINPDCNVDDDVMLGWFCNALCVGEDRGLARAGMIDPMWQRPHDRD